MTGTLGGIRHRGCMPPNAAEDRANMACAYVDWQQEHTALAGTVLITEAYNIQYL
jgi:hypothetical protein